MHSAQRSRGFTLIEILIACLLLGIGVTSVLALLLISLQRSREVTAMSTMGPVATAAVNLTSVHDKIPASGAYLDLPDTSATPAFTFQSPFSLRVDRADTTMTPIAAGDDANLITLRVRVYDNPDHRQRQIRELGTMFIRCYLRKRL